MFPRLFAALAVFTLLTACDVPPPTSAPPATPAAKKPAPKAVSKAKKAANSFVRVVNAVEPVAERECRARTQGVNCDFNIVVDDRPGQPVNAFQTLDRNGRPIIVFTLPMIAAVRNEHELAFVLSHETAHHISGHLARQQQSAVAGAVVSTGLAILLGGDSAAVQAAQREGAFVGSRIYSKEFELEADALGTVIAKKAGYDPLKGAEFFFRIPDPGNRFLGTHPPNKKRYEVVRKTAAGL